MRKLLGAFLDLLYPAHCLVCHRRIDNGAPLCQVCWGSIKRQQPPFCKICGREIFSFDEDAELLCSDCRNKEYSFQRAFSACRYEEPLVECIHLFKYKRRLSLALPLSELLIDFARNYIDMRSIDLVVPVPLHPVKVRERTFNQAELLARPLAERFKIEFKANGIRRKRFTATQSKLMHKERLENVIGAFEINNPSSFQEKDVLLVDDVYTSGATANECAKVMRQARAKKVFVLTLARG